LRGIGRDYCEDLQGLTEIPAQRRRGTVDAVENGILYNESRLTYCLSTSIIDLPTGEKRTLSKYCTTRRRVNEIGGHKSWEIW